MNERRTSSPADDSSSAHAPPADPRGRFAIALEARRLRKQREEAERRERELLLEIGAARAQSPSVSAVEQAALAALRAATGALEHVDERLASSLEHDRDDYAVASPTARRWVVLRGVFDRLALRDRRRSRARELSEARLELGRAAVAAASADAGLATDATRAVSRARDEALAARSEREQLLRPYGGRALPRWVDALVRESKRFAQFVAKELRGKLVPRWPAVAAMLVAWWITHTYTDSSVTSWMHELGLSDEGGHKVSSTTMERLRFWGPLLAAAVFGWASELIARKVRARYERPAQR